MALNPFTLGIVRKGDFCNRHKELEEITSYGRNGNNVVLLSPRRYGKSSLVKRVQESLEKEGYLTAYVDLFPITSERDFISRFSASIFQGIGTGVDPRTVKEKIGAFFSRFMPAVEITPHGTLISAKFEHGAETQLLLDDLMDGLYRYIKKKGSKACIVLDEFQEITELSDSKKIEGILRSHIQNHKEIAYFFVGSRRRILRDMFSKSRPFYKSAFSIILKEIPKSEFCSYIERRFKATGKSCSADICGAIYDKVRGYPYYVQKLSLITWDMTVKECTPNILEQAHRTLLKTESTDFEGIWGGLSLVNKAVLSAVAKEPTASIYTKEFLERYQLSIGGTQRSVNSLLDRDLIEKDEETKVLRVTDPIFGAWLSTL